MIDFMRIDHVGFSVNDMDRAVEWYQRVLNMEWRFGDVWTNRRDPVVMCNGDICVALFRNLDCLDLSMDTDSYNRHFAAAVNRENFDTIQDKLRALGVEFQRWDHEICYSIYFHDLDGHQIEVTTYEV